MTGPPSRQSAIDSLETDSIFGPSIAVGRAGCYPAGGVQLAAVGSQLPLTGPCRTGFKSAQAKETALSNVGVSPGASPPPVGSRAATRHRAGVSEPVRILASLEPIGPRHSQDFVVGIRLQPPRVPVAGS